MRTRYSFINMAVGLGGQLVNMLLAFAGRMIFIHYLTAEHLGVNGLFTNILGLLNLAELGIGTAMIYSMYKPVAEDDRDKICRLMNLYKILYRCVACAVFILGLLLFPFLDYFIKDNHTVEHIHFIYLMYLANTVASYLLSYKNSILQASQKAYVRVFYEQLAHFIKILVQILVLVFTRNFILYLLVQLLGEFLVNVLVAFKVNKDYSYLQEREARKLLPSREEIQGLIRNIGAMSLHRFGGAIVRGTDSLLMSAFVGLYSVGIYDNYKMVLTNLNSLLGRVVNAFTGSIGNLGATEGPEKIYEVFRILDFGSFLIYGYFAAGMAVLFNPFIELFFGENYLFSEAVVMVMVIDFYITGMRQICLQFRTVMGLFWYDRYKPLAEVTINLVVSIALVRKYGVVGIFIGTIVSCIMTCLWIEPYVLMKYGIKEEWKNRLWFYFKQYGFRVLSVIAAGSAAAFCCSYIPHTNLIWLIIKGIVYSAVYVGGMFLSYRKSWEFQHLLGRIQKILKKAHEK